MAKCVAMVSCYANFGLGKYFGGVPKFLLRDCDQNTRERASTVSSLGK